MKTTPLFAAAVVLMGAFSSSAPRQDVAASRPGTIGTAIITGTIVSGQAGQPDGLPVRRALVTLTGGPAGERRTTSDDRGMFRFDALPTGRYSVTATKPAFLSTAYGATRPGRAGTTLALGENETRDVQLRMARGAALEGRVIDQTGTPVAGVPVYALEADASVAIWASRTLRPTSGTPVTLTDDRGVFRLFGLSPGSYAICAVLPAAGQGDIEATSDEIIDALLARQAGRSGGIAGAGVPPAPAVSEVNADEPPATMSLPIIYFPGVAVFGQAQRIEVEAGDERRGLDFMAAPVPAGRIDGIVSRVDGAPLAGTELSIYWDGPRTFQSSSRPILSEPVGDDGRFRYTSVPPGQVTLIAAADPAVDVAEAEMLFGHVELMMSGQHTAGVSLVLRPGVTVSGRAEFDSATQPTPEQVEGISVRLGLEGGGWMSISGGTRLGNALFSRPGSDLRADGSFALIGLAPGPHVFSVQLPTALRERWWLRSAMANGRDLLDGTVGITDQDVSDVVLTFTDKRNELAGRLQTATGLPAPEYHVVAFPTNREMWRSGSRRITSTRPDSDGQYVLQDLPAGTYYLAALTDLEPRDLDDASFLELMAGGVTVRIADGERVVQNLQIAR